MSSILIVGGGDAGISAALRIRELDPLRRVTVMLADDYPNWSICGLPYFLGGETPDWHDLAHHKAFPGIDILRNMRAEKIDPAAKVVTVAGSDGGSTVLAYDALILATGSVPVIPDIPGTDLPGVHVLHTMDDALRVDRLLGRDPAPRNATILGAGYIGMEMAEALVHRGLRVTVVSRGDWAFPTVDPPFGEALGAELRRHGVNLLLGVTIEAIETGEAPHGLVVRGTGGVSVATDLVLIAIGVRPDTSLAASARVELGVGGAIRVDRMMRTNVPGIWAAGDCAETWHHFLQRSVHIALGTVSHKQGRVAAESILGGTRPFAGSVGTQVVKVFDHIVARTGLLEREARDNSFNAATVESELSDRNTYYPGASRMRVRVLGDRNTGRLLGAQILGSRQAEVAKRIDVFATALFHGMSVAALGDLDLSYAPPVSSPWDPVQAAALAWENRRAD
jgi:NADPH-dependent 2,4-dienoyl-CoA reductase/sulfur reductase-like enzyme